MVPRLLPLALLTLSLPAGADDVVTLGAPTRGSAFVLREELRMAGDAESTGDDAHTIAHSLISFTLSETVVAHLVVTDVEAGEVTRARLSYSVAERSGEVLGGPEAGRLDVAGRVYVVTASGKKVEVTTSEGVRVRGMEGLQVAGDFHTLVQAALPSKAAAAPPGTRVRGFQPINVSLGWDLYPRKLEATAAAPSGSLELDLGFAGVTGAMLSHGELQGTAALDPSSARLVSMHLEGPVKLFGLEKVDGLMMTTRAEGTYTVTSHQEPGAPHFPGWQLPPAASVVDLVLASYASADDVEWQEYKAQVHRLDELVVQNAASEPTLATRHAMLQVAIALSLTERAAGSRNADSGLQRAHRVASAVAEDPRWAEAAFPVTCELAFLELALAHPDGALTAADRALGLAKSPAEVAEAQFWRGEALRAKGDLAAAAAAYAKAAESPFAWSGAAAWGAAHSAGAAPAAVDVSGIPPEAPAGPAWAFGVDQRLRDGRLGGTTRRTPPGAKG